MAHSRFIKPIFFTDEELGDLPIPSRLLFIGLWCLSDREGRLEDRERMIKASIFPYDKDLNISSVLASLSPKFINRYEHEGKKYIQIRAWSHQPIHPGECKSVIPPPTTKRKANIQLTDSSPLAARELTNT